MASPGTEGSYVSCDVGNVFVCIVKLCLKRILLDVGMYFMGIY